MMLRINQHFNKKIRSHLLLQSNVHSKLVLFVLPIQICLLGGIEMGDMLVVEKNDSLFIGDLIVLEKQDEFPYL